MRNSEKLGSFLADSLEKFDTEVGDHNEWDVGEIMLIVEVRREGQTGLLSNATDPRIWVMVGLLETCLDGLKGEG
jgi:hypothetical protein